MSEGYVYILENIGSYGEDVIKIGKTIKSPDERANELSTHSGVLFPSAPFFAIRNKDCHLAEGQIHFELRKCHINKEFFYIDAGHAIQVIRRIVEQIGELDPPPEEIEKFYFRWYVNRERGQDGFFARGNDDWWQEKTSRCHACGRVFNSPVPRIEQCTLGHSLENTHKYLNDKLRNLLE